MLLALIAACCLPIDLFTDGDATGPDGTTPGGQAGAGKKPAHLGSAAASAAARPPWELDTNEAPQADADVLALADTVDAPIRDGVLACTVTSSIREGRILERNQAPDLEVTMRWGDRTVALAGPDNLESLTVSAPLAVLDPSQAIMVTTKDRQLFHTRVLAEVAISPARLPLGVDVESVNTRCVYVTRDRLEALAEPALQLARTFTAAWEPSVDLEADGSSLSGPGAAAQQALRRAASMIGWDDPRVVAGVAGFEGKYQRYLAEMRETIGAKTAGIQSGSTDAGEVKWSGARLLGTAQLATEWSNGPSTPWGVAIPVEPQAAGQRVLVRTSNIGGLQGLQLFDGQGGPWELTVAGTLDPPRVDMAPTVSSPTTLLFTPAGDGQRISPVAPLILRARMEDGWLFQRVD